MNLIDKIIHSIPWLSVRMALSFLAIIITSSAYAQKGGYTGIYDVTKIADLSQTEQMLFYTVALLLLTAIVVLIACIYVYKVVNLVFKTETEEKVASEGLWLKVKKKFITGTLVPVENEKDIMLDHAYDGIVELNNHMPPWLKYVFYLCVVWGFGYVAYYLVFNIGMDPLQEYQKELAIAEEKAEVRKLLASYSINEDNVVLIEDMEALSKAEKLYLENCAACHRADGGGSVGPNLTDEYWLHGGTVKDIFKVIKYGVQEKGMIPWQDKLNPEQIQSLTSYILSLQGSEPANAKAPQGDKF